MISLDCRGAALIPLASQIEVICALAADVALANVFLAGVLASARVNSKAMLSDTYVKNLGSGISLAALTPAAN